MADLKSPEHALEQLPGMLNLVLIQTGHLLRDPECRGPRAIGLTKSKVNEFVPVANRRFHDHLDEIEIKILDAKAVMERDLSAIRKKRALREGVKVPSAAPSPVDDPTEKNREGKDSDMIPIDGGNDSTMLDTILDQLPGTIDEPESQAILRASGDQAISVDPGMAQDAAKPAGLAITLPTESKADEKDGAKTTDGTTQETEAKGEDMMATANEPGQQAETSNIDFDFGSMFDDADFSTADGTMNFDLDFSTTTDPTSTQGNQSQNILADNALENITMTDADLANVASSTNEDITVLLDDVFNQAGDAANGVTNPVMAAPGSAATTEDPLKAITAGTSQGTALPAATDAATSQFDDLFGNDTFDLGGNGEIIGNGDLVDFDFEDEWLKMSSG